MTKDFKKAGHFIKRLKVKFGDLQDNIQKFYRKTYDFFNKNEEINIEFKLIKEEGKWSLECPDFFEYIDYEINTIEDLKKLEKQYLKTLKVKYNFDEYSFIYIIKSNYGVKIGVSNNPFNRISQINTSSPFDVELLHILFIHKDYVYNVEKGFHKHFKDKKISGEWFSLSDDDIKIIYCNYILGIGLYTKRFFDDGFLLHTDLSKLEFLL